MPGVLLYAWWRPCIGLLLAKYYYSLLDSNSNCDEEHRNTNGIIDKQNIFCKMRQLYAKQWTNIDGTVSEFHVKNWKEKKTLMEKTQMKCRTQINWTNESFRLTWIESECVVYFVANEAHNATHRLGVCVACLLTTIVSFALCLISLDLVLTRFELNEIRTFSVALLDIPLIHWRPIPIRFNSFSRNFPQFSFRFLHSALVFKQ